MTMTHKEAQQTIATARNKNVGKPLQNNTRLHQHGEGPNVAYGVVLHGTEVVTINADGTYTLRAGGYHTITTMDRIRGYSPAKLFSERGDWYVQLEANKKDPQPERYDRSVPKPYEATDPGPEPVKDYTGCVANQLVTTEHVDEPVEVYRKDLSEGEEVIEVLSDGHITDYDRVKVLRSWNSHTWVGEHRESSRDDGWFELTGQHYNAGRHVINDNEQVKYVQCSHCKAFDDEHERWRYAMHGDRYSRRFDEPSGYATYAEMMDRYEPEARETWATGDPKSAMDLWQEAYIADFRARKAYLKAHREWEERNRVPFFDGITVNKDGYALRLRKDGPSPAKLRRHEKAVEKMKKRIDKYVDGYIAAIKAGMPMPGNGDCWYCLLHTEDGRSMGDIGDNDHLISHMEEKYYVPMLAVNALRERGYKDTGIYMFLEMKPEENAMGGERGRYENVKRDIRNYMRKRLVPQPPTE